MFKNHQHNDKLRIRFTNETPSQPLTQTRRRARLTVTIVSGMLVTLLLFYFNVPNAHLTTLGLTLTGCVAIPLVPLFYRLSAADNALNLTSRSLTKKTLNRSQKPGNQRCRRFLGAVFIAAVVSYITMSLALSVYTYEYGTPIQSAALKIRSKGWSHHRHGPSYVQVYLNQSGRTYHVSPLKIHNQTVAKSLKPGESIKLNLITSPVATIVTSVVVLPTTHTVPVTLFSYFFFAYPS